MKSLKKDSVDIATLPPALDAFKEHLKRTYFQVQSWIGFIQDESDKLDPTKWG